MEAKDANSELDVYLEDAHLDRVMKYPNDVRKYAAEFAKTFTSSDRSAKIYNEFLAAAATYADAMDAYFPADEKLYLLCKEFAADPNRSVAYLEEMNAVRLDTNEKHDAYGIAFSKYQKYCYDYHAYQADCRFHSYLVDATIKRNSVTEPGLIILNKWMSDKLEEVERSDNERLRNAIRGTGDSAPELIECFNKVLKNFILIGKGYDVPEILEYCERLQKSLGTPRIVKE